MTRVIRSDQCRVHASSPLPHQSSRPPSSARRHPSFTTVAMCPSSHSNSTTLTMLRTFSAVSAYSKFVDFFHVGYRRRTRTSGSHVYTHRAIGTTNARRLNSLEGPRTSLPTVMWQEGRVAGPASHTARRACTSKNSPLQAAISQ